MAPIDGSNTDSGLGLQKKISRQIVVHALKSFSLSAVQVAPRLPLPVTQNFCDNLTCNRLAEHPSPLTTCALFRKLKNNPAVHVDNALRCARRLASLLEISKALEARRPSWTGSMRYSDIEKLKMSAERHLSSLRESEPKKYIILKKFYEHARAKQILFKKEDAARLASELGLGLPKKASRELILVNIIQQLSSLPLEQLERRIKNIIEHTKRGQTLEEWANVILKERNEN